MDSRTRELAEKAENLLESVLSQDLAFSPPPSRRQSSLVQNFSHEPPPSNVEPVPSSLSSPPVGDTTSDSAGLDASWKAEYESQVEAWRAQSAEAREKAEKERLRWEEIRAAEKKTGETVQKPLEESGWESIAQKPVNEASDSLPAPTLPSTPLVQRSAPADDHNPHRVAGPSVSSHSRQDTGDESQKWEDLPSSLTSSFPSMSFPEHTDTPQDVPVPETVLAPPRSVTLSIFDSSLSPTTRFKALFSSLAINLLLPFVNGVMLGFGEIFAKNVVLGWLGWKTPPGVGVANVGLGRKPFR